MAAEATARESKANLRRLDQITARTGFALPSRGFSRRVNYSPTTRMVNEPGIIDGRR
jgi:hypothetical protein